MAEHRKDFISDFRNFFGKGLAILLPTVLTLWILVQAYLFVDAKVAQPINRGIRVAVLWSVPFFVNDPDDPPKWIPWYAVSQEQVEARQTASAGLSVRQIKRNLRMEQFKEVWDDHWYSRFTGLLVAMVLIYFAGVLLGGYIGRRVYKQIESFLSRLPVFKLVYPHVKQVVDLILGERPMAFRRVVLVQYPRKGIYTLGFVTSDSIKTARNTVGEDVVAIFVPSTPMPFTGFTITVPKAEVIDVPLSIDEAVRFFITGGVLVPDAEAPSIQPEIGPSGSTTGNPEEGGPEARHPPSDGE